MVCRAHNYADGHKVVKDHYADGGAVHVYGSSMSTPEPDPNRVQRKPSPPTKEGIAAYEKKAHEEAVARAKAKEQPKKPATPSSNTTAADALRGISAVANRKRDLNSAIDKASE